MKKRWKTRIVFFVLPAFFLEGCGVWMKDMGTIRSSEPYEVERLDVQRATRPEDVSETVETSPAKLVRREQGEEKFVPAHWRIIDDGGIPAGSYPYPKFDADPVWKVDKNKPNTFKAVEEYAKKNGLAILKNEVPWPAKMTSGHKPPKFYLIPPGKYILYKPEEQADGDVILTPVEVPSCRNQLLVAPKLLFVPRTKIRVDREIWEQETIKTVSRRYRDTQVIEQRYRDVRTQVDQGASALWFLGGLAAGIGLGYLFWYGSTTAAVVSGPCAVGGPGPVPPVP